jgi:hypothetical protein
MKIDWLKIRDWGVLAVIVIAGAVILGWSIWSVSTDPGCCCR